MIKIAFTGDIMLARSVGDKLENRPDFKILDGNLEQFLLGHDYVVGNLECPFSVQVEKLRPTGFKANPIALQQLSCFNLFSLANNHIFDCGKYGALETMQYVIDNNQQFTGMINQENDTPTFITTIQDKQFSFLSCAVNDCIKDSDINEYPKVIEAENPDIYSQINSAKAISNYTIVMLHGGDEMIPFPKPKLRKLCESFIDSGADVVVTHHPHVVGGVHHYKKKYIFYSLGDFVFDGESYLRRRGLIISISFNDNNISYKVFPTQIKKDLSVCLPDNKIKALIVRKWDNLSNTLNTEKKYNNKYRRRYIQALLEFQLDRLFFLLKNKGIKYLLKFMIKKTELLPFYLKKIGQKTL